MHIDRYGAFVESQIDMHNDRASVPALVELAREDVAQGVPYTAYTTAEVYHARCVLVQYSGCEWQCCYGIPPSVCSCAFDLVVSLCVGVVHCVLFPMSLRACFDFLV